MGDITRAWTAWPGYSFHPFSHSCQPNFNDMFDDMGIRWWQIACSSHTAISPNGVIPHLWAQNYSLGSTIAALLAVQPTLSCSVLNRS
jgi:hypothetical protein